VSRLRTLSTAAATTLGLVVLFVVFIGFKDDTALVAALSAAGTVAAGAFAAVAAVGSMRAAAEIEYRDQDGVGHWQDTWKVATESPATFHQVGSNLAD
jgi:hypothetical protein